MHNYNDMEVDRVQLNEVGELEPLVLHHLDRIEEGLKPLVNQIAIGANGRPDILAVDENGALVLIELKSICADLSALSQVIRYYEWSAENLALIARPFPTVKPDSGVRLILVAPEFDEDTLRLARYVDLDLMLVRYTAIKHGKTGDLGIIFDIEELEPTEGPGVDFRSVDDILSYCTDPEVLKALQRVMCDLSKSGIDCHPYHGGNLYWIECSFRGDPVAYFQPRRKYFNFQIYDSKKQEFAWPPRRLTTYKDWARECKRHVTSCLQ